MAITANPEAHTGEELSQEQRLKAKGVFQALGNALPHRTIRATYMCLQRMVHQGNYLVSLRPA